MGRSRNIRALTANVEKPLSDAVGQHCERLGKPVSQWLGSAAELNLAIDAGKMALFDVSTMELEKRKQWAQDWIKSAYPGDLNDEGRRLLYEQLQCAEGYTIIPAAMMYQMLLGFYNTQEQFRANAERWEKNFYQIVDAAKQQIAKAVNDGFSARDSEVQSLGQLAVSATSLATRAVMALEASESEVQKLRNELKDARRKLACKEEPENCC